MKEEATGVRRRASEGRDRAAEDSHAMRGARGGRRLPYFIVQSRVMIGVPFSAVSVSFLGGILSGFSATMA